MSATTEGFLQTHLDYGFLSSFKLVFSSCEESFLSWEALASGEGLWFYPAASLCLSGQAGPLLACLLQGSQTPKCWRIQEKTPLQPLSSMNCKYSYSSKSIWLPWFIHPEMYSSIHYLFSFVLLLSLQFHKQQRREKDGTLQRELAAGGRSWASFFLVTGSLQNCYNGLLQRKQKFISLFLFLG